MKNLLFLLLLAFPFSILAQSDRVVDSSGDLLYQYSRTIEKNADNNLVVTLVFVNGKNQTAISLRQESMSGNVQWLNHNSGKVKQEKIVNACTANISPNQSLSWTYLYKPQSASASPTLERCALMIMQDDYQVNKIMFPPAKEDKSENVKTGVTQFD